MNAFLTGAAAYPLIELAYRGRTHYSMSLAGGCAGLILDKIRRLPGATVYKAILGAGVITGIEYAAGRIWNRDYTIWDYRRVPLNYKGQICLPYTLLWGVLSTGGMSLLRWMDTQNGRT